MFSIIKNAISTQFDEMKTYPLYRTKVDKESLWNTYLSSFLPGTNPVYKERTEHDCNCCKSFIRAVGNLVAIIDGKLVSIWDVKVDDIYQPVVDKMSELVKSFEIDNIFLYTENSIGTNKNFQTPDISWGHFYIEIPVSFVFKGELIGPKLSESRSTKDVFLRGLKEITLDSIDTVLELIAQNSLYRGEEHLFVLNAFRKLKVEFAKLKNNTTRDIYAWSKVKTETQAVTRIRNTSIGTLLIDLSEGYDLEDSVKSFEQKVAPTNYKRPTALVTKAMIQKAEQTLQELGFVSALERRFATLEDITINNILFANRQAKKSMNVFEELSSQVPEKVKNLDKVEEITIDNFISNVLPKAESIEVMFENKHANNLVSLIAPVDSAAKIMFKWGNPFSWSYTGEVADSIKERVKQAGGKVDGDLRCSLSWFNYDDLDLHMLEPKGNLIYFGNRSSHITKGNLDVDMNAGSGSTRTPVENICYPDRKKMQEGVYKLSVHNYRKRETKDVGFEVEFEFDGIIHSFVYSKAVMDNQTITVVEFRYSHKNGITIINSLPNIQVSKQVWNIPTQTFHKVNVVMNSPNYWDEKTVGNKHFFFMLENCHNDDKARGFYNEFLTEELNAHRKVFEIVGSKMKTEESENQLSGLGFSSTQRNSLICRVKGHFTRTLKINF